MKVFDVVPKVGVGAVRLGMSREEVRRVMDEKPHVFRKTTMSRHETDAFHQNGFQVFYGGDEPRVEYIELSGRSGFVATFRGQDVFETPAEEIVEFIARESPFDDSDPELGYTHTFPSLELALWRPTLPEAEDDPEGRTFATIGIGVGGYFSGRPGRQP